MYDNDARRVMTPECRASYVHVTTPRAPANNPNGAEKYSMTLLIPKSTPGIKDELDAAQEAAAQEAVNRLWGGVRPSRLDSVVHDGDGTRPNGEPFGPECAGCWVLTASSPNKPWVCGADNTRCELAPQDIYSGMYGRASINFYGYNSNGKRGVGCGLRGFMKTRDGEPLSGAVVTAAEFEGLGSTPAPVGAVPGGQATQPGYVQQAAPAPQQAPVQYPNYGAVPAAQPQAAPAPAQSGAVQYPTQYGG